jgi:amphi-Trp domain-containing protein
MEGNWRKHDERRRHMARKRTLIRSKERRSTQEIAAFLRQLADRLEENEITLQRGDEEIRLEVPDRVTLKLRVKEKAKRRGTKHQLKLALRWTNGEKSGGFVKLA